jgi:hypothetical protein
MLSPLDWNAAATYLDFREPFTNNAYHTTFAKLRSNDQFSLLARRVRQIANQHADGGLIDYKQRRATSPSLRLRGAARQSATSPVLCSSKTIALPAAKRPRDPKSTAGRGRTR